MGLKPEARPGSLEHPSAEAGTPDPGKALPPVSGTSSRCPRSSPPPQTQLSLLIAKGTLRRTWKRSAAMPAKPNSKGARKCTN